MKRTLKWELSVVICLTGLLCHAQALVAQEHLVSKIKAFHYGGQTFLQWEEEEAKKWTTFNVYRSDTPIKDVNGKNVQCLAREIIPRSGRNFYRLRGQFFLRDVPGMESRKKAWKWILRNLKPKPVPGIQLPPGHGLSSPTGGLFVHTVRNSGKSFYAVTYTPLGENEEKQIIPGRNALAKSVAEKREEPQPYQVAGPTEPFPDGDKKKQGVLSLYAYMGSSTEHVQKYRGMTKTYLFWMPAEFGWREGLPTMMNVRYLDYEDYHGYVRREYFEFMPDDSNFAFMGFPNSWWYGYDTEILHPEKMKDGVVKAYSHRKLEYLLQWFFKNHPQIERETFGVRGGSMGGTGALCFGMRHPEWFAYIDAGVPGADLATLPQAKVSLEEIWGSLGAPVKAETGKTVWEEVSNYRFAQRTRKDLPFIRMSHGRIDLWMVWDNSIKMHRALSANRHGFVAAWHPGGHDSKSMCTWRFLNYPLYKIRTDRSFIAITDCSNDEKLGSGDKMDGDKFGNMNLYVSWAVEKDTAREYAVKMRTVKGDGPTLTITLRRTQGFKPKPGETLTYLHTAVHNNARLKEGTVKVDAEGMVTIENLGPVHSFWSRVVIKRK